MKYLFVLLCFSSHLFACDWDPDWPRACVEKLQLQGHERILDVGCGDGQISALVARHVPDGHVVGVDTSDSLQRVASGLIIGCGLGCANLTIVQRSLSDLNFDQEFDLVTSFGEFHLIPDQLLALQEIERALVPGGRAFLFFSDLDAFGVWMSTWAAHMEQLPGGLRGISLEGGPAGDRMVVVLEKPDLLCDTF